MINLDQVRTLEWKVKQAVQLIVHLRRENDSLRGRISDTEVRLQELESLLEAFKASQNEMESGIRSALEELDHLEGGTSVSELSPVEHPSVPVPVPVSVPEVPLGSAPGPVDEEVDPFEEEFAALAAEEAAKEAEVAELTVPDSVELEASEVAPPEVEGPVPEKEPEQPGLGIF